MFCMTMDMIVRISPILSFTQGSTVNFTLRKLGLRVGFFYDGWQEIADQAEIPRVSKDMAVCSLTTPLPFDGKFLKLNLNSLNDSEKLVIPGYPEWTLRPSNVDLREGTNGEILCYRGETQKGHSGSPVISREWSPNSFGIHARGNEGNETGEAMRFSKTNCNFIISKIKNPRNENWKKIPSSGGAKSVSSTDEFGHLTSETTPEDWKKIITHHTKIKAIEIVNGGEKYKTEDFSQFTSLISLSLRQSFLPNFKRLKKLQALYIFDVPKFDLQRLNSLKNLKIFSLEKCKDLETKGLTLTSLDNVRFTKVEFKNLEFLKNCSQLKILTIKDNKAFQDSKNLSCFTTLEKITLSNLPLDQKNLTSLFEILMDFSHLKRIEIHHSDQKLLTETLKNFMENFDGSYLEMEIHYLDKKQDQ